MKERAQRKKVVAKAGFVGTNHVERLPKMTSIAMSSKVHHATSTCNLYVQRAIWAAQLVSDGKQNPRGDNRAS